MLAQQIAEKRWAYFLDQRDQLPNNQDLMRVMVAVEDEAGSAAATLGDGQEWYTTQECCEELNRKRGIDPSQADAIVRSSRLANTTPMTSAITA